MYDAPVFPLVVEPITILRLDHRFQPSAHELKLDQTLSVTIPFLEIMIWNHLSSPCLAFNYYHNPFRHTQSSIQCCVVAAATICLAQSSFTSRLLGGWSAQFKRDMLFLLRWSWSVSNWWIWDLDMWIHGDQWTTEGSMNDWREDYSFNQPNFVEILPLSGALWYDDPDSD